MAVFHAVERGVWKRALLMVLLLAVATVMYWVSDSVSGVDADLAPTSGVGPVLVHVGPEEANPGPVDPAASAHVRVEPIQGSFFDEYRLERDRSRSLQLEQLKELLGLGVGAVVDEQALADLMSLLERTELELQAEGLLRARGLSEALVVVADSGAIVVVTDPVTQVEAGSIGAMVAQVTGIPLDRITISDGIRLP